MNNIQELDKIRCVGCMACVENCPRKCIDAKKDELGFTYPNIDIKSCISCGVCKLVCPVLNKCGYVKQSLCFAAIHKQDEIWKESSSGGAFSAICSAYKEIVNDDIYVFGASYKSEKICVEHMASKNQWDTFRKSKYVQSDMSHVYKEISNLLEEGKKVIFSGTPCQNAAIYNYLKMKKIDFENVLLIDLICHGVGSPKTFQDSIISIIKRKGQKINNIVNCSHRNKKKYLINIDSYHTTIESKIGKDIMIKSNEDFHTNLFAQKLNCRDSCENCEFAYKERLSDITIADFKNIYKVFPTLKTTKNASTIVLHTEKSMRVFEYVKKYMDTYPCKEEDIISNNPLYAKPLSCQNSEKRKAFRNEYINEDDKKAVCEKYCNKINFIDKAKSLFPEKLKQKVKEKING